MNIKMIATDLDSTLLKDDKTVSEYTLSILNRCREKGILIAIDTARSQYGSRRIIDLIKPDIVIANTGGHVTVNDKLIFRNVMSAETADAVVQEIMKMDGLKNLAVETDNVNYHTGIQYSNDISYYSQVYDFKTPLSLESYKITAFFEEQTDFQSLADKYPECHPVKFKNPRISRLNPNGTSKMEGIRHAAEYLNIDIRQVAAFGDDYGDLDMIAGCGHGVAMGNAAEDVKAAAKYICDTNENDGVAKWLEQNVLYTRSLTR